MIIMNEFGDDNGYDDNADWDDHDNEEEENVLGKYLQ